MLGCATKVLRRIKRGRFNRLKRPHPIPTHDTTYTSGALRRDDQTDLGDRNESPTMSPQSRSGAGRSDDVGGPHRRSPLSVDRHGDLLAGNTNPVLYGIDLDVVIPGEV